MAVRRSKQIVSRLGVAWSHAAVLAPCVVLIAGCATIASPSATPARPATPVAANATASPGPAPGAAAAVTPSGPLRAFSEIVKDAHETPGFFTLWRKDEKLWFEVKPEQFDHPFFMAVNLSRGLGERGLFAGLMGDGERRAGGAYLVVLRRVGNTVQLVARNTTFVAADGSHEAHAVARAFSDSLLSSAPVTSLPHPERKSVLVDANALLLADIPRGSHTIEAAYRNLYTFDRANSFFESARSDAEHTVIDVTAHYAQAHIPLPPPMPAPGVPYFPAPDVLQDPRSLFLGFLYTFTKLPEVPMHAREADARIGHFVTTQIDFSAENRFSPRRYLVNRWRLDKKDPDAPMSEPVKPIVFWLDRDIPTKYRDPIRAGILEWNKAFERIGFKNAIVVKEQPDDADFDTGDTLHASVRWFTTSTPSFGAIGPSQVDPRTGEILDADIGFDSNQVRNLRFIRAEMTTARNATGHEAAIASVLRPMYDEATGAVRADASGVTSRADACTLLDASIDQAGFGLALLEARGLIDPEGPQADAFVAQYLKNVSMHEVGHTLGLRHNFRASTVYTPEQLNDPRFTATHGITGSVMEYAPINIALHDEPQGDFFSSTLGPYDYWAIEYAYKPIAPDREVDELAKIAARSNEPMLAFATDQDANEALDPAVNPFDLGTQPLAYYRKRVMLSRELWGDLQRRPLKDGESYEVLRRRFLTGFTQIAMAMNLSAKYVGGMTALADKAGSPRAPLTPVALDQQRAALALITDALFRSDSFRVPPDFLRKLVRDRLEIESTTGGGVSDLPIADLVLAAQRDVLNRLMSPIVAQHLESNAMKSVRPRDTLALTELYGTLQGAIWSEVRDGSDVDPLRRNLQRDHARRIAGALLAPTAAGSADARALLRANAKQLRDQLAAALTRTRGGPETRAHYAEVLATLDEALKAPLIRAGS